MIIPVFLSPVHFIRGNFHRHITRAPLRTLAYRLSANRQGPSRHFPAPIPHIKEGCLAAPDSFSCKPPQKLAVSKHLHAGSSPAWRLNSALPGVRQRRQDVRENFLHAKAKKQHNFFTGLREKKSGRPGSLLSYAGWAPGNDGLAPCLLAERRCASMRRGARELDIFSSSV